MTAYRFMLNGVWTPETSLISMPHSSNISLTDSLKSSQRQAFYEGHKDIALIMILVVFLFPLFGVYISGLLGAAVGMIISISAYFLTPYVKLKIGAWRWKRTLGPSYPSVPYSKNRPKIYKIAGAKVNALN